MSTELYFNILKICNAYLRGGYTAHRDSDKVVLDLHNVVYLLEPGNLRLSWFSPAWHHEPTVRTYSTLFAFFQDVKAVLRKHWFFYANTPPHMGIKASTVYSHGKKSKVEQETNAVESEEQAS